MQISFDKRGISCVTASELKHQIQTVGLRCSTRLDITDGYVCILLERLPGWIDIGSGDWRKASSDYADHITIGWESCLSVEELYLWRESVARLQEECRRNDTVLTGRFSSQFCFILDEETKTSLGEICYWARRMDFRDMLHVSM